MKNFNNTSSCFSMKRLACSLLLFTLLVLPTATWSQDSDDDGWGVGINVNFVSTYVFRGDDLFTDWRVEDDRLLNFPMAIQPDLTFYTPIEGLYFNIWASVAFASRDDSAEGEEDGLARADEIDYSIMYETERGIGSFTFGVLAYTYLYDDGKTPSDFEVHFSYSPSAEWIPGIGGDLLSGLYLSIYSTIVTANNDGGLDSGEYFQFGYGYEYEIIENISTFVDLSIGVGVYDGFAGLQNLDASIGASAYGATLSVHYALRMDDYIDHADNYEGASRLYFTLGYGIDL